VSEPANPLRLDAINVAVAGSGGIARALVARLLADYPVATLHCLQRSDEPVSDDPRVTTVFCDATEPASIVAAAASVAASCDRLHLVINAVGLLHGAGLRPEKRLQDVSAEALVTLATVNAFFLPQLAGALAPLLRHDEPAILASLSARVGSITDNGMGGWYSYRASNAAHNMLLRTLAREWRLSHKHCSVIALHPGTVKTALSEPYTPANYRKRVLSPRECAAALLGVLAGVEPSCSGSFLDWQGEEIPW